jgi:phosphotransferase family enzyme
VTNPALTASGSGCLGNPAIGVGCRLSPNASLNPRSWASGCSSDNRPATPDARGDGGADRRLVVCEHQTMTERGDHVTEMRLEGGDMNPVVRIGDTVRRPPEPEHVRQLLLWYERVGFDGAPRFLGYDEQGREILSFIEGEPVPSSDNVIVGIGELLRRAHDAQNGLAPPGRVFAHMDSFWTNVIFRTGIPFALIDWELARPATRIFEVALAATYWAGLRIDEQLIEWGIPLER